MNKEKIVEAIKKEDFVFIEKETKKWIKDKKTAELKELFGMVKDVRVHVLIIEYLTEQNDLDDMIESLIESCVILDFREPNYDDEEDLFNSRIYDGIDDYEWTRDAYKIYIKAFNKIGVKIVEYFLKAIEKYDDDVDTCLYLEFSVRDMNKKIADKFNSIMQKRADLKVNYWKFSLGTNAELWEIMKNNKIISIGWGELGKLFDKSKDEISNLYKNTYNNIDTSEITIIDRFVNQMKPGDKVIINKGQKCILAIGIITSDYYYTVKKWKILEPEFKTINYSGIWSHFRNIRWDVIYYDKDNKIYGKTIPQESSWLQTIQPLNYEKYQELLKV